MITVHHLNNSRSQRILWLLEELELPYRLKTYQRDPVTSLAPPELKAVHPLGKSPVLSDEHGVMIESGAIIDHLIRRHGAGRLQPSPDSADYDAYQQWLHYAEGSAVLPLILHLYVSRLGEAGAPLHGRINSEISNHVGYLDASLAGKDYLVGNQLSGADIAMSFVAELAGFFGKRAPFVHVERWIKALQARPAYQAALEKGGAYAFGV